MAAHGKVTFAAMIYSIPADVEGLQPGGDCVIYYSCPTAGITGTQTVTVTASYEGQVIGQHTFTISIT